MSGMSGSKPVSVLKAEESATTYGPTTTEIAVELGNHAYLGWIGRTAMVITAPVDLDLPGCQSAS